MNKCNLPLIHRNGLVFVVSILLSACGGGGDGSAGGPAGGGSSSGISAPATPTGIVATPGNAQVALTWGGSTGATSYAVSRTTTSGGPYTSIANSSAPSYTDTGLTNGTTYYYVVSASNAAGASPNSSQVSATPSGGSAPVTPTVPVAPTGVSATPGNAQVALTWTASAGASSYAVGRATTSGGPYTSLATPSVTSYTDSAVANGTTYYYVVSATNSSGTSSNSSQVSATPVRTVTGGTTITIDVLSNRHYISPYVYGGNSSKDAATITDSGATLVRWGGNQTSNYNWQLFTYNSGADYFYEDFVYTPLNNIADRDSAQFIRDVKAAGSAALTTMSMMDWVAKAQGVSFPATTWPSQCQFDQYNSNAGNGLQADCKTPVTTAAQTGAYYPLLDQPGSSDPPNSVYRNQWAAALSNAFGAGPTCPIPYSTLTSCHFYDMDNEVDIWSGSHRDVHPAPSGYEELRDVYLKVANGLKGWDPAAVRLGPVVCCWWFYWNGANGNDRSAHGGVDFLPWWLNEVYWRDQIAGTRSLDVFDIHAYAQGPDTTGLSPALVQAAATRVYREYWDPTYTTESAYKDNPYVTLIEPKQTNFFRIPRMRAIVNSIYPGTPLAFSEWSAAFAGESDFSTALGDADGYGIFGRERVALATRWGAPDPANPNYQALKLFTNYDGAHHGFNTISVSATNNADPNLLSVYAASNAAGNSMTVLVLNKDPSNAAQATFNFKGFTPSQATRYTLSQGAPKSIVAGAAQSWNSSTMSFPAYTATLLVITGSTASVPAAEWDLNPDTIRVPAGGQVTLHPQLVSGSATLTISAGSFDAGITPTVTGSTVSGSQQGSVLIAAGSTPGFYHFNVKASDGTTQGGWIVVGNPPAALAKTAGADQSATAGTVLPVNLAVTLSPGQSGGSAAGASVFFTTSAGSLQNVLVGSEKAFTGSKVIAVTNSSGVASVSMTLPATLGGVQVTAEGPYDLGHPVVTFAETAQ